MQPVTQYTMTFASSSSMPNGGSAALASLQPWNFSMIQAASPTGESVRP